MRKVCCCALFWNFTVLDFALNLSVLAIYVLGSKWVVGNTRTTEMLIIFTVFCLRSFLVEKKWLFLSNRYIVGFIETGIGFMTIMAMDRIFHPYQRSPEEKISQGEIFYFASRASVSWMSPIVYLFMDTRIFFLNVIRKYYIDEPWLLLGHSLYLLVWGLTWKFYLFNRSFVNPIGKMFYIVLAGFCVGFMNIARIHRIVIPTPMFIVAGFLFRWLTAKVGFVHKEEEKNIFGGMLYQVLFYLYIYITKNYN
jgi:hypothetical protein